MDVIGIAALAVAVVGIAASIAMEAVRRPRLRIEPSEWRNPAFVTWTFATVRVYDNPVAAPLRKLLARRSAEACKAEIEYYEVDSTAPFLRLPGRWSSVPEPLSLVPASLVTAPPAAGGLFEYTPVTAPVTGGTAPTTSLGTSGGAARLPVTGGVTGLPVTGAPAGLPVNPRSGSRTRRVRPEYTVVYDPARDPGQRDVAVSNEGEEIAVAIFRDDKAFAFSTESYRHPRWGNPDWRLERGKTYRIVVRVQGSSVQQERAFRLAYLTNNPSDFRLQAID